MPYQHLTDGLYLVKRRSAFKPAVDHYAVLDIGNRLGLPFSDPFDPTVVHQSPPSIQQTRLSQLGPVQVVGVVVDEQGALARLRHALVDPRYDLFGHNCEHFARFVVTGARESTQLQGIFALVAVGTLIFASTRSAA
jgi:hypothetical protein